MPARPLRWSPGGFGGDFDGWVAIGQSDGFGEILAYRRHSTVIERDRRTPELSPKLSTSAQVALFAGFEAVVPALVVIGIRVVAAHVLLGGRPHMTGGNIARLAPILVAGYEARWVALILQPDRFAAGNGAGAA